MYLLQILLSDLLPSGSRHDGCQVLDLYVLRNDSSVSDAHNQSITTLLQRGDCLPLDWRMVDMRTLITLIPIVLGVIYASVKEVEFVCS